MNDKIIITKHAVARYMQRCKCYDFNAASKKIIELYKKSTLIRLQGTKEKRYASDKNIFFICERKNEIVTIVTITMSRTGMLKNFADDINHIDYTAMGASKLRRKLHGNTRGTS